MARPDVAQLITQGQNLGLNLMQEKRARDVFGLENEKFQQEKQASEAINGVYAGEAELAQKRATGAQVLGQFRKLAAQSPSVRKATAPVIFDALEQSGLTIADNMKQFVMTGKTEEVAPVLDRMIRAYSMDPNRTIDDLTPVLSVPLKASEIIGTLSRQEMAAQSQAAITGPQPNPRRDQFLAKKVAMEREISKLEQVAAQYAHTRAVGVAVQKANILREQLAKMENVLSSQEANAQGIPVRPGTVLTETGAGNISVLQGPDTHGGGSLSGLKPSEINVLKSMAHSEFESDFNIQTGEMHFKNRGDGIVANNRVAAAARIYLNAGGKLTLPEAYLQARKGDAGGSPVPGQVDPVTGQPRNHFAQYDQ